MSVHGIVVLFGFWGAARIRAGTSFVSSLHCRSCCISAGFWSFSADDLQVYCHFLVGKEQVALQLFRDCSESVSR